MATHLPVGWLHLAPHEVSLCCQCQSW